MDLAFEELGLVELAGEGRGRHRRRILDVLERGIARLLHFHRMELGAICSCLLCHLLARLCDCRLLFILDEDRFSYVARSFDG